MSAPGLIEAEPDGICQLCHAVAETRPYGPGGKEICFECGMKTPEETERKFARFVLGEPE